MWSGLGLDLSQARLGSCLREGGSVVKKRLMDSIMDRWLFVLLLFAVLELGEGCTYDYLSIWGSFHIYLLGPDLLCQKSKIDRCELCYRMFQNGFGSVLRPKEEFQVSTGMDLFRCTYHQEGKPFHISQRKNLPQHRLLGCLTFTN